MEDHFHPILYVTIPQSVPLGTMVRCFKARSTSRYRQQLCADDPALPLQLWETGYQDTILYGKDQLDVMRAYVLDNPRRLAVKRSHPELFQTAWTLPLRGVPFSAYGNFRLLFAPQRLQIQCSRAVAPEALALQQSACLTAARQGAVLLSPCISPGEQAIAHAALDQGLPLIVICKAGFGQFYKPPGRLFDACAAGHLLMLSPWSEKSGKVAITQAMCDYMNACAAGLATFELAQFPPHLRNAGHGPPAPPPPAPFFRGGC